MSTATQDFFKTLGPEARILFVRLRSMGDCLLLTVPLRLLKSQFPEFALSVLVEDRFEGCFSQNPDLTEVVSVRSGKFALMKRLLRQPYDAVINLHGGPTSLMFTCAPRGVRIGIEGFQYQFLYSGLIPRGETRMHSIDKTIEWFRWMGLDPVREPKLSFAVHGEEAAWARDKFGAQSYVVIHPAATTETKRWASERFAAAGQALERQGWQPIIIAGPGEESLGKRLSERLSGSQLLEGLTIPQLAELIRGADLYLGNDSGPMHLAAAVGTPTVAVWGSSNSVQWRPWGIPHRVVQNPFDCNPCAGYRCEVADTPLCIESVSVEQVIDAAQALLEETGRLTPVSTNPV